MPFHLSGDSDPQARRPLINMNDQSYHRLQLMVPSLLLETALFSRSKAFGALTLLTDYTPGAFTLLVVFSTYILVSVKQNIRFHC
jgi:hypothetical protein